MTLSTTDLLKRIRKIEIKSRGLSQNVFSGEYHSAFKGRGMRFSEVREYQYGDDLRDIDWNVTARHNKPYIKVYEEERELTVMLLVDVSRSEDFGTTGCEKKDMVAEIAATLAFSAVSNNDKIGALFFTDRVEKYIPPNKGRKQILLIIRELLDFKPQSPSTDIGKALIYFNNASKKRTTVFLISDFIDGHDYSQPLSIARNKHDMMAIQVFDKRDTSIPNIGLVRMRDFETGMEHWVDTSSRSTRQLYERWWYGRQQAMAQTMRSARVDFVSVSTDEDYVKYLRTLFKNRQMR